MNEGVAVVGGEGTKLFDKEDKTLSPFSNSPTQIKSILVSTQL